jgi:hypothetical protein
VVVCQREEEMFKMTFKINGAAPTTRQILNVLYVVRWYKNKCTYRVDGPAVVWLYDDGDKEYFHYGD